MKIVSMFFGGFLCQSIYDRKKGTVVWPSIGMFRGSMSSDCLGGFLNQITTQKKKVQSSGHWLQCQIVMAGSLLCILVSSLVKLQIMTEKKGTISSPTPVSLTPFATHVTFYFYYVCTLNEEINLT